MFTLVIFYTTSLFLIKLAVPISAKFDKCSTNEGGPQKNVPCVFPFIFADRIYYKCTSDFDKDKKFWCSTKVDEEQHHISHGGNWGYCSNSNCRKLIESLIVELYLIFANPSIFLSPRLCIYFQLKYFFKCCYQPR